MHGRPPSFSKKFGSRRISPPARTASRTSSAALVDRQLGEASTSYTYPFDTFSVNMTLPKDIEDLHRLCCERGEKTYKDPKTGYTVFTAVHLKAQGACCGNGCRHCPFGHQNVKDPAKRKNLILEPVFCPPGKKLVESALPTLVVFFSGGKDSFMAMGWALDEAAREGKRVCLLSTYDPYQNQHGTQKVPLHHIQDVARSLGLDLVVVPVAPAAGGKEYVEACEVGIELAKSKGTVDSLVFGDIELEDLKIWREESFGAAHPRIHFPIWKKGTEELLALFEKTMARFNAKCTISAVDCPALEGKVKIGDVFDREFVAKLPPGVHAFGENGEFHTQISLL